MAKVNMNKLRRVLTANPRNLDDKRDLFKDCAPDEYKELVLHALTVLCKNNGDFTACRTDEIGWSAHHITKAVFEEQSVFDPYSDEGFIQEMAGICPWYITRYTES